MKLGNRIKEMRIKYNLTQEDLANKLHITRQTISKWESNKSIPDIMSVKELCQIFNISIDEFLCDTTYSNKSNKLYYILFFIGLGIFCLPYLLMLLSVAFGMSVSSGYWIVISLSGILQKTSYAFIIASIGLFIFDKYK